MIDGCEDGPNYENDLPSAAMNHQEPASGERYHSMVSPKLRHSQHRCVNNRAVPCAGCVLRQSVGWASWISIYDAQEWFGLDNTSIHHRQPRPLWSAEGLLMNLKR
jgi:hypothetical protein